MSQNGNFPQFSGENKKISKHHHLVNPDPCPETLNILPCQASGFPSWWPSLMAKKSTSLRCIKKTQWFCLRIWEQDDREKKNYSDGLLHFRLCRHHLIEATLTPPKKKHCQFWKDWILHSLLHCYTWFATAWGQLYPNSQGRKTRCDCVCMASFSVKPNPEPPGIFHYASHAISTGSPDFV